MKILGNLSAGTWLDFFLRASEGKNCCHVPKINLLSNRKLAGEPNGDCRVLKWTDHGEIRV